MPVAPVLETEPNARVEYVETQISRARAYTKAGELHHAQLVWQSVLLAQPSHASAKLELGKLKDQIKKGVEQHLRNAQSQQAAGQISRARTSYQKVLALHPGHTKALNGLSSMLGAKVRRQAEDKATGELAARRVRNTGVSKAELDQMRASLEAQDFAAVLIMQESHPQGIEHPEFKELLVAAHAGQAQVYMQNKAYEDAVRAYAALFAATPEASAQHAKAYQKAKNILAQKHYTKGLRQLRTDPEAAVTSFGMSLQYNPNNAAARGQLATARKMLEKLKKLKVQQ